MPKILHISSDEKFINSTNYQFESAFTSSNKFAIIVDDITCNFKHVENKANVSKVVFDNNGFKDIIASLNKYDLIVLHGMTYNNSRIVLGASNDIKFLWLVWGREIYDNPLAYGNKVIGEVTKEKIPEKINLLKKAKEFLQPITYSLYYSTPSKWKSITQALKKINYVGVSYIEEVDFFKLNKFIKQDAMHFVYSYYPIEFIFKGLQNVSVKGNNILIGNSASRTNNHLEVFDILKNFNLESRKLIVPLSYGDKIYGSEIEENGNNSFGDNFEALTKFMPLHKYNSYIQQCGIVIMNNYRQQAIGNIMALLWIGAKVYLDERNTLYHYLKRVGIEVFSIGEDLNTNNVKALEVLDSSLVKKNREILKKEIGEKKLISEIKQQINSILG